MSIQDSNSTHDALPTSSTTLDPYLPGTSLHLFIDKTYDPSTISGKQILKATVTKSLSSTMATIVEITYASSSTSPLTTAVLKLYDRRFGTSLRRFHPVGGEREGKYVPPTSLAERSYESYVRCGKAAKLWEEIDADNEQTVFLPKFPEEYYGPTEEGLARYEGALQYDYLRLYAKEIAAYDKLTNLQGKCIP